MLLSEESDRRHVLSNPSEPVGFFIIIIRGSEDGAAASVGMSRWLAAQTHLDIKLLRSLVALCVLRLRAQSHPDDSVFTPFEQHNQD